jgi:hypothetical protein
VLLCELVNAIAPGIVKKIHRSRVLMFQNENVTFFQQACRSLGVPESNLFALSALRDGKDPLQVIHCLLEVKRMDRAGLLSLSGGGVAAKKASRWTVRDTGQPRERLRGERVVRGLDADIQAKYNAKLRAAAGLQASACAYLSARTGRGVEPGRMSEALMDGVLLCALLNTICPGAVPEVNVGSKIAFKHVENLTWFQEGARRLGVPESNLFSHSDLREGKDPLQVLQCVLEIKRRDEVGLLHNTGVTPSRNVRMGFGSVDLPSTQHSVVHRVRQQSFEHRRAAAAASKEEQIHLVQEARDEEELQATLDAIDAATATATH